MKIVLLLSGGIDSTVLLAKGLKEGHEMFCLSVWYGGLHNHQEYQTVFRVLHQDEFLFRPTLDVGP